MPGSAVMRRVALERTLTGRFWLRGHLTLMLLAALSAGMIADYVLLNWPVHGVAVRWLLCLAIGYATFFVAMRIWLAYVGVRPLRGPDLGNLDDFGVVGNGGGRAPIAAGAGGSRISFGDVFSHYFPGARTLGEVWMLRDS